MWDKLLSTGRLVAFFTVIIIGILAFYRFNGPKKYDPSRYTNYNFDPIPTLPAITHGDPSLPQPNDFQAVVRVTVRDTITAKDTVGTIHTYTAAIYIPLNSAAPPVAQATPGVEMTYTPIIDSWFLIEPHLHVGGSFTIDAYVSPWGGISFVRLFRVINAGPSIDRSAAGLFASWEFYREFNLGAQWNALPLRTDPAKVSITVNYRF